MTAAFVIERAAVVLMTLWVVVRVTAPIFRWGPDTSGRVSVAGRSAGGWIAAAAIASALVFILNYPVDGWGALSAAEVFLSFNTTVSVGMMVMAAVDLYGRLTGARLLCAAEVTALTAWNVVVGLTLYAGLFGCIPVDIYSAGFGPSWFFIILFLVTVGLVVAGSALWWVFIIYLLSWASGLIESQNIFDYVTDPLLVAASTVVLATGAVRAVVRRSAG